MAKNGAELVKMARKKIEMRIDPLPGQSVVAAAHHHIGVVVVAVVAVLSLLLLEFVASVVLSLLI